MSKTMLMRVKVSTYRAISAVAKYVGCTVPELMARIEDGDLESLAGWQRSALEERDNE